MVEKASTEAGHHIMASPCLGSASLGEQPRRLLVTGVVFGRIGEASDVVGRCWSRRKKCLRMSPAPTRASTLLHIRCSTGTYCRTLIEPGPAAAPGSGSELDWFGWAGSSVILVGQGQRQLADSVPHDERLVCHPPIHFERLMLCNGLRICCVRRVSLEDARHVRHGAGLEAFPAPGTDGHCARFQRFAGCAGHCASGGVDAGIPAGLPLQCTSVHQRQSKKVMVVVLRRCQRPWHDEDQRRRVRPVCRRWRATDGTRPFHCNRRRPDGRSRKRVPVPLAGGWPAGLSHRGQRGWHCATGDWLPFATREGFFWRRRSYFRTAGETCNQATATDILRNASGKPRASCLRSFVPSLLVLLRAPAAPLAGGRRSSTKSEGRWSSRLSSAKKAPGGASLLDTCGAQVALSKRSI